MSKTSPIKNKQTLVDIKNILQKQSFQNYLLFRIGVNLGIPSNELNQLHSKDLLGKKHFFSGKYGIRIADSLQEEIRYHVKNMGAGLLFRASGDRPLSRFQIYNILRDAGQEVGMAEKIGTTTLRKTFAYWAYVDQLIPLSILSKYLGHNTLQYTLKYMELEKDAQAEIYLASLDI